MKDNGCPHITDMQMQSYWCCYIKNAMVDTPYAASIMKLIRTFLKGAEPLESHRAQGLNRQL